MQKTAVVVFSGGQDSTVCLIQALREYQLIYCLTFYYGQRHNQEINIARNIALELGVQSHKFMDISVFYQLSSSSLISDYSSDVEVGMHRNGSIPSTFVPGRNILFLTLASMYAYQLRTSVVIMGVCETDFLGYPDCRNTFILAMNHAISLGMQADIIFKTPLMWFTKAEIWALADLLGVLDFVIHETITCYNGIKSYGCRQCDSCYLRNSGLKEYLNNKTSVKEGLYNKNHL
ncbi:7-cyano-7-deazaguanine synthase QueC [Candidatus Erwinia haradaeae]|uniref:7-cyano-7-deazaguanine synthase n=1 Tax=Candidatus Erwinia haradaeae TaxID=1922217 RepID=A0A803FU96_9GAMM|nr:7-cyano-7-deazaguanine synthase QueC [Candidatus Erwinia haradaeae]VFP88679.1 7-cyano-7-deazaguanine synthase [Candidatus Erwinia haradaeae]